MTLQILVAAVQKEPFPLIADMQLESGGIIVSQGMNYSHRVIIHHGSTIEYFSMKEKGVGLNRNHSLQRATADIILFADEDIIYQKGYKEKVLKAFEEHPKLDLILFNVVAAPGRETYHIDTEGRVRWYNCGRYPTYSIAARTKRIHSKNINFSLLFGGGANYSNGEDSLFLFDCLKKGLKIGKVPITIGKENGRESTWFQGFHYKFFFDRGVLYSHLYGKAAALMGFRFLFMKKKEMCVEIPFQEAFKILLKGIKEGYNIGKKDV